MTAAEVKKAFITVPEIARATGESKDTVHNWLKYHRHMPYEIVLDRPCVRREDFERFRAARPDLKRDPVAA